jgi:23S rRNA (adenine2503-C2)-methyltransferase
MSMGEPMLNFSNVEKAIRMLNKLYPTAQLLISTSGPLVDYSGLMTLAKEIDKVGLQFSVHESNDAARNKLIPFKAKLDLEDINKVGEGFFMNTGRQPYFNYCAHENNTLIKNVDELSETFDPSLWQVTVSVVCEKSESVKRSQERQIELTNGFMSLLLERGYSVRTFNPAGQDDIGGGCGQLFYVQNWMKNNPALTRKSSGRKIIELIAA